VITLLESRRSTRTAFTKRDSLELTPRSLSDLLAAVGPTEVRGRQTTRVESISYRSEETTPGGLFFCVPGRRHDGHDFAWDAAARGAVAVLVERWLMLPDRVTQVLVPSVREAMGPVAAEFYGRPAGKLILVGITGTNGKTTTTYVLEQIFRAAALTPAVIGTTGLRLDGRTFSLDRTTPEAPDLHRLLASMVEDGIQAVAMEVSSHGLHQERVAGARFACAVFTNLSQDHLDYHGTFEAYFQAKARLFTPEMADRAAVNNDSPEGRSLLREDLPTITYGVGPGADLVATDIEMRADGVSFRIDGREVRSRLRGAFNVHNCLAALAAARQLGIEDETSVRGVGMLGGVPGRLEPVEVGQPFQVLVDYAHTPDSVENVLRAARPLAKGKLIVILGCGGDRDRGKRPLMGEAATRLSDLTVITSDNPRSERPEDIMAEIEPGAREGGGAYVLEPDRRSAVRLALEAASPGDVLVIAGKGHETGQEFADRIVPFDDRAVAGEELQRLGWGGDREEVPPSEQRGTTPGQGGK
jgi:UDP-N-acetylmuramoyl-L-alanyl-D-glutamate--2,6-diaminopimelate ligase